MMIALLILGTLVILTLVALERDRVWTTLQAVILVLTGGVLIAPLRAALAAIIGPLARFIRAALDYGDSGVATAATGPIDATDSGPNPRAEAKTREPVDGEHRQEAPDAAAAASPRANYHLNRVLAALVLVAITGVLGTFDYEFLHLTFAVLWGLPAAPEVSASRTVLTSLALMASLVLWGTIALELGGYTHFMREFPTTLRRALKYMTIAAFVVGVSSALVMGIWRARAVQDLPADSPVALATVSSSGVIVADAERLVIQDEPATGFDALAPVYLSAAIPVLVLVSSMVSFTGVMWLAKYLAILGLWICLVPLAVLHFWVLPTLDNALAHVLHAVEGAVDLVASVGRKVVDTVWPPLRSIRAAFHRRIDEWAGIPFGSAAATGAADPVAAAATSAGRAQRNVTPPPVGAPSGGSSTGEPAAADPRDSGAARDLNWDF